MKISVCMATYNGEKFIKYQLESIIHQLAENDEIIISDDGSTDSTIEIVQSFVDPRIRILHNQSVSIKHFKMYKSYAVSKNFENALAHATGEIIFLSDQDDWWHGNKVKVALEQFHENKVNLLVHDALVVDENYETLAQSYFELVNSKAGFIKNIIVNSYLGCCLVFDRKILLLSLPFPSRLVAHDVWIGLIAEQSGKVAFIEDKLIKYRRHNYTVTNSGARSQHKFIAKIGIRIQLIVQLAVRTIQFKTAFSKKWSRMPVKL